jgi:hypothetical protein
VEAQIVADDRTALDAGADVGPVILWMHSLFSDVSVVELQINPVLISCIRMSWGVQVPFLSENIIRCVPLLGLPTSGLFSLGRDGEMITRVLDPIQYCPLLQRRFQTVEIDIRDDTGFIVPFERGRVVATLHCRKRKEFSLE